MKKRILFAIDSLGCGGAEKSLIALLHHLDYSRMDVDLLLFSRGGMNEAFVPENVNILDYTPAWPLRTAANASFSIALRIAGGNTHNAEKRWKASGRILPRHRKSYDIAIAYQQGFPTFFITEKVRAAKKIAWVNVNLKAAGYSPDFCRRFYSRMDAVVAVSDMLAGIIVRDGFTDSGRLETIYDITNPTLIRKLAVEYNPIGDTEQDAIRITTVGRITPQKNYGLAVAAASILKERGLRFIWYFVGDGIQAAHIRQLIARQGLSAHIRMAGEQINPYPYFAAADIYVQTSAFEGFGLTLSEARILGRPVVTTDFDVARQQISDGVNGLIANHTPEDLADKIMMLAGDPVLRNAIGTRAATETNTTATTESEKANRLILGL